MEKDWSLKQVERFMSYLSNKGWEVEVISEGVLGVGHLRYTKEGKTVEIREYYISPWASGHKVKSF